ncbi:MAG TPA: DUF481 domain-containing protein [Sphingobium sp.]
MALPLIRRPILLALCAAAMLATPAHAEIPPPVEAMIREAARKGDQTTVNMVAEIAKATNPTEADAIDRLAASLLTSVPPFISPAVEAIIREAARTGDQTAANPVVNAAKTTNPGEAEAIGALASSLLTDAQKRAKEEREKRLASLSYLQGWEGQGQAGFGLTSGNTEEVSGIIGISIKKEGLQTRHKFEALVDYLRTNNVTTRKKLATSYSLDWLLREGFYAYGVVGWEQDRFAGYARRFTESFGVGIRALDRKGMTLDLDAGPAFRQTAFTDSHDSIEVGPRASLNYKWLMSPAMTFTQIASIVSADGNMTLTSNSGFTSKITKALSGRLSFNVQSESNRQEGSKPTDTATRATLVYEF